MDTQTSEDTALNILCLHVELAEVKVVPPTLPEKYDLSNGGSVFEPVNGNALFDLFLNPGSFGDLDNKQVMPTKINRVTRRSKMCIACGRSRYRSSNMNFVN